MRISINPAAGKQSFSTGTNLHDLAKLLARQGTLRALVRRLGSSSIFLKVHLGDRQVEVEVPLQGHVLTPGQLLELTLHDEHSIYLKVLEPPGPAVEVDAPSQLEHVLAELNIPPTEEAILVAKALVDRGFPLQESLVWSILPWAEQGFLEEAFLALEARFPLKQEVLTMIRHLVSKSVREPILTEASEIPTDLLEPFKRPSLENRTLWENRLSGGEAFKALARLLVEERFVEAFLSRQGSPHQFTYVFALPFLRQDNLYAGWLRITRDSPAAKEGGDLPMSFRIELQIPTASLGLVDVELVVEGKEVSATLSLEAQPADIKAAIEAFGQELNEAGWQLRKLQVRRWSDAEGSGFTL